MAGRLTKQERQEFLAEPRVAVLSVANGAGRPPHATSIWYAYEPGSEFTFFTGTQGCASRKAELIESAGALTLSVQRSECPYTYVSVEGTVVRTDRPPSSDQRLAIVCRYMTAEQARGFILGELDRPAPGFFLFTVQPDRWLIFDLASTPVSGASSVSRRRASAGAASGGLGCRPRFPRTADGRADGRAGARRPELTREDHNRWQPTR